MAEAVLTYDYVQNVQRHTRAFRAAWEVLGAAEERKRMTA